MNRRGVALVVGVVLAIGFGAWWLSALPVEENHATPPAPAPIVERVEVPASPPIQPIAPEPESVVAPQQADAGVLAEVEIEIVLGNERLIGTRVELEGPGGRVSRPTDVMGFARFTIPTGSWRITAPPRAKRLVPFDGGPMADWYAANERALTTPLEVTAPLTRFRLELPKEWQLRGRVVDNRLQPVIGAELTWAPFNRQDRTSSGLDGQFTVKTTEPSLQLQAKRGSARSMLRTAGPGEPITVILEEWTQLKVEVTNKRDSLPRIRVLHRDEIVAVGIDDEVLQVPVGHLEVLARAKVWGQMQSGRGQIDAKAVGENRLEIELKPTPPISGVLIDGAGNRMPGLGVAILEVDPTTVMLRGDGGIGAQLATATIRTNERGEFAWQPRKISSPDPLYQVAVVELWQAKADPVLVRLDDAPLSIVVEPAPAR